jgi:acylglycerol lipase
VSVKATLIILHGTVDHSGIYAELGNKLAACGIAVFAMDQRGWGLSDGESMYMNDMDTYVADVDAFYQNVHSDERYANVKPRFLLGKSMGGTVTAFCVAKYPDYWTGLIGLSGAYELDPKFGIPSPTAMALLYVLAKIAPKLPFKPLFDQKLLVSDPGALQALQDDELCSKDRLRVGYAVTLLNGIKELSKDVVQQINLPILMLYGDRDHVVTKSGHELMIQKSPHTDKSLKTYPGGLHNLLQEPSLKEQVMSDIEEWLMAHI